MSITAQEAAELVRARMTDHAVASLRVDIREYPDETIIVVAVRADDLALAAEVSAELDRELHEKGFRGFVAARAQEARPKKTATLKNGVAHERATELANLLSARARTSEVQPSLSYIRDIGNNVSKVSSHRHHLVFGRRGAGKTALLLEAKRLADKNKDFTIWLNMQTLRRETGARAFIWFGVAICDLVQATLKQRASVSKVFEDAAALRATLDSALAHGAVDEQTVAPLIPRVRAVISRFLLATQRNIFVFIDDLHYLARTSQPSFLDAVHGAVRDANVWLKVAAIKHLSRWFISSPPTGLQTGHDAHHIDLDVSLQDPSKAKKFLEQVLSSFAKRVGITSPSALFANEALDRLVLASGGVPRDYLELSSASIREAQVRTNARAVGVQDVNKAAGDAAAVKVTELEDDAASAGGEQTVILDGLQVVRRFCLDTKRCTYFRVDFSDKEQQLRPYTLLQSLMDLRLVHLVNASVSDPHQAGRRAEVLMLDLSQFTGQRFKKNLRVLDFLNGRIVSRITGTNEKLKVGSSPKTLLALLRQAPLFDLSSLPSPP